MKIKASRLIEIIQNEVIKSNGKDFGVVPNVDQADNGILDVNVNFKTREDFFYDNCF